MIITMCASLKFHDETVALQKVLEKHGHTVYMPIKAPGVDYWDADGGARVAAKKGLGLIAKHMDKIQKSDAILVANYTKKDIENYIGANTFAEILFASYMNKQIYFLNPLPDQPYIIEELQSVDPIILNGDISKL